MTQLWLPGAIVVKATRDGGAMTGGSAKVIWHTTENDASRVSALAIAQYLNRVNDQVNIVWNPTSGQIVQSIPANRAGRGLVNAAGGVETNRGGSVVLQIEVVGRATQPFTDGPCVNLDKILAFIKQLGVPSDWPAGDLKPYPASYGGYRSASAWNHGGHFGHSQVPENYHGDPGNVNQVRLSNYSGVPVIGPTPSGPTPVDSSVVRIQKIVGAVPDGIMGPNTKAKIKVWQAAHGCAADGIWGPISEAAYKKSLNVDVPVSPSTRSVYTTKAIQSAVHVTTDGKWGPNTDRAATAVVHRTLSDVKYLQARVGAVQDGIWGPNSEAHRVQAIKRIQSTLQVTVDGAWGPKSNRAWNLVRSANYGKY